MRRVIPVNLEIGLYVDTACVGTPHMCLGCLGSLSPAMFRALRLELVADTDPLEGSDLV